MTLDVVELTCELVACNTVDANEESAARMIAPLLADAGFSIRLLPQASGRSTLLAEWGTDNGRPPLCLSGHFDTVPLGEAPWSTAPFHGERSGDRLYGRGTTDMKGGVAAIVVASVEAAQAVRRSSSARGASAPGLRLLLTSGEETGCLGVQACADELAARPGGPILIAEPTSNAVYNGHKGAFWLRLDADGIAAHGSCPDNPNNAVLKLVEVLHDVTASPPAITTHPTLGVSTLNVSTFHGGLGINAVPDAAHATLDLRTVPGQEHDNLRSAVAAIAAERAVAHTLLDLPPVWTAPDREWSARVHAAASKVTGQDPGGVVRAANYFTDGALLGGIWPEAEVLICGPGEPTAAHTTDEWCSVTKIEQAVAIYREVIRDWCRT